MDDFAPRDLFNSGSPWQDPQDQLPRFYVVGGAWDRLILNGATYHFHECPVCKTQEKCSSPSCLTHLARRDGLPCFIQSRECSEACMEERKRLYDELHRRSVTITHTTATTTDITIHNQGYVWITVA